MASIGYSSYAWGGLLLLAAYRGHTWLAGGMLAFYALVTVLDRFLLDATTAMLDLPYVGKQRGKKLKGTAVIAGGSMGGILAARMLADQYERVILIDDEQQASDRVKRPHVQQHNRLHALSAFVTPLLARLFPELDTKKEVEALGGTISRFQDLDRFSIDGDKVTFGENLQPSSMIVMTRPTLESFVRRRVLRTPNVELVWGRVTGLQLDQTRTDRVSSVDVTRADGTKTAIEAALVVDATGATSAGQRWLKRLGYEPPRQTHYNPHLPYVDAMCFVNQQEWDAIPAPPRISKEKMGAISMSVARPIDEKKGIVIVHRSDPGGGEPTDVACFHMAYAVRGDLHEAPLPTSPQEFADACRDSDIGRYTEDLLQHLAQLPRWHLERVTVEHCTRVHYDELTRCPANFVAVGDAMSRLNPTFGQGITKASRDATTLNAMLYHVKGDKVPDGFSLRYFKKNMKRVDSFIDGNRLRDATWPQYEPGPGEITPDTKGFLPRFLGKLVNAAHHDLHCAGIFAKLLNGFISPLQLFTPETLIRMAWANYLHADPAAKHQKSLA